MTAAVANWIKVTRPCPECGTPLFKATSGAVCTNSRGFLGGTCTNSKVMRIRIRPMKPIVMAEWDKHRRNWGIVGLDGRYRRTVWGGDWFCWWRTTGGNIRRGWFTMIPEEASWRRRGT